MRLSPSPIRKRQKEYSSKLKLVDEHLLRTQETMARSTGFDSLMNALALKMATVPPLQIPPLISKSVMLDSLEHKKFLIKSQSAPKDKKFVLRVSTHVPVKLTLKIDDRSASIYNISGNKGIPIEDPSFKQLAIDVRLQKHTMFSSTIKLLLDIINADFQSKGRTAIALRPKIDKELQAYLKENRGRSGQILRERAIERMRARTTRRVSTGGLKKSASCEVVREKKELQHFERHKSFFIKHFRKMSPERLKDLQHNEQKYRSSKLEYMGKLSMLIIGAKFSRLMHEGCLQLHRRKMRQIKITMLCRDFIKIVKNKFKLKMTHQARMRMVLHHTLHFVSKTTLHDTCILQARETLKKFMKPYMDYRMIEQLGANSQDFLRGVITVQKFLRFKEQSYLSRILFLIDKLCYLNHIALTDTKKHIVAKKYLQICKQDSIWVIKIFSKRDRLVKIIREEAD